MLDWLEPDATRAQVIAGLQKLGIRTALLAALSGARSSTITNWAKGRSQPSDDFYTPLASLRDIVKIRAEGGCAPELITEWLITPQAAIGQRRPVDLVVHECDRVRELA